MPTELETEGDRRAPSVWLLAWLLFTQHIALLRMYQAWGIEDNPSLISLWRERQPKERALITRHGLVLVVVMPLTVTMIACVFALSGVPVQPGGVAAGVAVGIVGGVAGSVARAVAFGLVFGVAFGVAFGMAIGAVGGLVFGAVFGGLFGSEVGVPIGILAGVVFSVLVGSDSTILGADDLVFGTALGITSAVVFRGFGVESRMAVGALIVMLVEGGLFVMLIGVTFGMTFGIAFGVAFARVPLWVTDALITQWLSWQMSRHPRAIRPLALWLPFRSDGVIPVPLPGLRTCLIRVGEVDPTFGTELIALAGESTNEQRSARLAIIELQARVLECAARDRLFSRVAGLDHAFLPTEADVTSNPLTNAPFRAFQIAARDLVAGSTNQRQRRLALERSHNSLKSFRISTIGASRPGPLATRLLATAALWLEVIRDETDKLTREIDDRPEVPSVFIAGPPLTPDRVEDRTLFKGRADIIKLIEHDLAPDRRGVLLIVGQRRMGKTSLCNWLPVYLGTGTTVIASNFQPLSGDAHREIPHWRVLRDIAARMVGAPAPPASSRWGDGLRWLEDLDRNCAEQKILVVIDEVERVEDGIRAGWCSTDFLDFLRAAGDVLRHTRFLLLTAYPLHRLGPHWTDRLVSVTSRTLSYLDEEDGRALLTHPIAGFPDIYPDGGVDLILAQTGRHPYLLQKAGDDLCRMLNSRGGLHRATLDDLTEIFDGMVRDVQVFDDIWGSRTEDERATLRRVAASDHTGDLDSAAIQLAREGYLERRGDKVAIVVPLFREWIRENVK